MVTLADTDTLPTTRRMQSLADKDNFFRAEAELILDQQRKEKADRIKDLGSPIELAGIALAIQIRDQYAWIAENTSIIRKVDLETGKTVQRLRGHTAPATMLTFIENAEGEGKILITGSWDKSINIWDTETSRLISSTPAHSDFVKTLLVIPSCNLLISGSSDKIVRFWDLTSYESGKPLPSIGSISAHTRPVECLVARSTSEDSAILYTGDTMGIIKVWELTKETGNGAPRWKATLQDELQHHRTGVVEMIYGTGQLWTASFDETAQVVYHPPIPAKPGTKPPPPLTHPKAVKAILPLNVTPLAEPYLLTGSGDIIRAYDMSSPEEPDLLGETDAHWHDVTALRLWMRKTKTHDGKTLVEPWVISTSLDRTIRKWRLADLLKPPPPKPVEEKPPVENTSDAYKMSEEEERELAELMGNDD
ncbi:WD40 repeat-like protein [Cristinia sonorae]|uniref:WD40 repeat-like protein n=1 Tax=Cristinia sonorae TaxID=1940300 RepID=A0A8K0XWZ4_9AGAR|nr:WD40 repeat-like protein [Cristinia sonorae]